MKFGRSYDQQEQDRLELLIKNQFGYTRFAWVPTKLRNGEWVWWENYVTMYSRTYKRWYGYAVDDPQIEKNRENLEEWIRRAPWQR